MRIILSLVITIFSLTVFGQQITADEWHQQSETNIRLLPKYGYKEKTEAQKQLDKKFITETLQHEKFKGNRTAASDQMIKLGFDYLYRGDIKTAMYRFNQAFLFDSTNTDIYWGYG